jgi:hypothetical protein
LRLCVGRGSGGRRWHRDCAKRCGGTAHVRRGDRVANDVQPREFDRTEGRNVDRESALQCRDKLGFVGDDLFLIGGFADEVFGDRCATIRSLIRVALGLWIREVHGEFPAQAPLVPHLRGNDARSDLYVGRAPESHSSLRLTVASSITDGDGERVKSLSSIAQCKRSGQLFGATDT